MRFFRFRRDVGESSSDADSPGQSYPCLLCNIFELASAQIFPELVPADLTHEIEIVQPTSIYIGDRDRLP
jgi:hypothetical protein